MCRYGIKSLCNFVHKMYTITLLSLHNAERNRNQRPLLQASLFFSINHATMNKDAAAKIIFCRKSFRVRDSIWGGDNGRCFAARKWRPSSPAVPHELVFRGQKMVHEVLRFGMVEEASSRPTLGQRGNFHCWMRWRKTLSCRVTVATSKASASKFYFLKWHEGLFVVDFHSFMNGSTYHHPDLISSSFPTMFDIFMGSSMRCRRRRPTITLLYSCRTICISTRHHRRIKLRIEFRKCEAAVPRYVDESGDERWKSLLEAILRSCGKNRH